MELLQRKAGGGPGLPLCTPFLFAVIGGKEGAAGPLAVRILMGKELCAPALAFHPCALGLPFGLRRIEEIAQLAHRTQKPVIDEFGMEIQPAIAQYDKEGVTFRAIK